jgi:hypothetical protein
MRFTAFASVSAASRFFGFGDSTGAFVMNR